MTDDYARRESEEEALEEWDEAAEPDETAEPAVPPDEEPVDLEIAGIDGESMDLKLDREEPDVADEGPLAADEITAPPVPPDPSQSSLLDVDPPRRRRTDESAEEAALHEEPRDAGRRGR